MTKDAGQTTVLASDPVIDISASAFSVLFGQAVMRFDLPATGTLAAE